MSTTRWEKPHSLSYQATTGAVEVPNNPCSISNMRTGILRGLLWSISGTAALTGLLVALFGNRAIPGATDRTDGSTSSVLRFYSVIWAAQAIVVGRAAAREKLDHDEIAGIGWLMAAGGTARALAWRRTGPPHALFRVLTVQELAMPLIVRALR